MRLTYLLIGLAALACHPPDDCWADEDFTTRFVLQALGPRGNIQSLAWSADSQRLYCGGHQKVVNAWDIGFRSVPRDGLPPLPAARPLNPIRWDRSRGTRGVINSIALSENPGGLNMIAIGGYSAFGSMGDIPIVDLHSGKFLALLAADPNGVVGHGSPVTSVSFSKGGKLLLTAGMEGNIFLWTRLSDDGRQWSGKRIVAGAANQEDDQSFRGLFLDETRFVVAIKSADDVISLDRFALDGSKQQLTTHFGKLTLLTASPFDNRWASADSSGRINFFDGEQLVASEQIADQVPNSIAFLPNGDVLLATHVMPSSSPQVHHMTSKPFAMKKSVTLGQEGKIFAMATSPDGARVAIGDDSDTTVKVLELRDAAGAMIASPLDQLPVDCRVLGSHGARIDDVQFLPSDGDDAQLQVMQSLHDGTQQHANILMTPQVLKVEQAAASQPIDQGKATRHSGGWSLASRSDANVTTLKLTKGNSSNLIQLNKAQQGTYDGVHCFIRTPQGQQALAVGTNVESGIFIYRLDERKSVAPMVRNLRDHSGDITSLDVTPDGRYLVSGSIDQTVKLWSLKSLFDPSPTLSSWGAKFGIVKNRVIAYDVMEEGIAHARGLRNGTQITRIGEVADAKGILNILMNKPLFLGNEVHFARPRQAAKAVVIRPAWEPILTFFLSPRYGWVAFTPHGYYDASAAHGHRLFGWHFNGPKSTEPRFELASNIQKDFERPAVIRNLARDGSVPAVLRRLQKPVPQDSKLVIRQKSYALPQIDITSPVDGQAFTVGSPISITARVRYGTAFAGNNAKIVATIDGRFLGPPAVNVGPNSTLYSWTTTCRAPSHAIAVRVAEQGPVLGSYASDQTTTVRGIFREVPPTTTVDDDSRYVGVVAIGCQEYDRTKLNMAPLKWPRHDANEFAKRFSPASNQRDQRIKNLKPIMLFDKPKGDFVSLTEWNELDYDNKIENLVYHPSIDYRELSYRNFATAVAEMCGRLGERVGKDRSRATLIIYANGHGTVYKNKFYFVPANLDVDLPVNRSVDYGRDVHSKSKFSWSNLADLLGAYAQEMNVLLVLDACKSGAITSDNDDEPDRAKANIRNARASYLLVACGQDESSIEVPLEIHGLFTQGLLLGLDGDADSPAPIGVDGKGIAQPNDNVISFLELGKYADLHVEKHRAQNPRTQAGYPKMTPIFGNPDTELDPLPLVEIQTQ